MSQDTSNQDLVIAAARQEIVFIMSDVGNHQQLAAQFSAGREVVILDAARDGLAQIAQALQGRSGIDAVHVISHGSAGALGLGSLTLGSPEVAQRQPELAAIGASLSADGDILLYGCDAGADAGLAGALAIATGADVALSDDLTGHAALGGDWELEVTSGNIEATPLVDAALAEAWADVLAITGPVTITFDDWGNVQDYGGGTAASSNVVYRVNGDPDYALVMDGLTHGTSIYEGFSRVYMGSWTYGQPEREVSLSFAGGQTFTAQSLQFYGDSTGYVSSQQTLQIVGYGADGQQVGSAHYVTLPGSWSTPATLDLSGLTGIQTLKIRTTSDGGDLWYFAMDTLELADIQSAAPAVASVSSSAANGTYKVGDVIPITVNFDQSVVVTGTPQLTLETGTTDRVLNYASGNETSSLTFHYTVQAGDTSADLDVLSSTALRLNGGTISSAGGTAADLTLPVGNALGSLATNKALVVDGVAPSAWPTASSHNLKAGETSTLTFSFTEAPVGLTLSDFAVSGGTLGALSGSGLVYTAVFTPTAGVNGGVGSVSLPVGAYTDAAGNGNHASGVTIYYDTLPPAAPSVPTLAAMSDTGSSPADAITRDDTPTFTGFAEAGTTVRMYASGSSTVLGTAVAGGDGRWTLTTDALTNATHTLHVTATDAAGNVSTQSGAIVVTIDTLAPPAPAALVLAPGSDTGASTSDGITSDDTPTVSGVAQAGATVWLYDTNGVTVLGRATADGSGAWSITTAQLSPGAHSLKALAEDAAGNLSPLSTALEIQVDRTSPTLAITSDRSTVKVGESAVITFTFSEDPGASFTMADLAVSGGTLGPLSGTGTTRTGIFTPTDGVDAGTASIVLTAGSYADAAGNPGGGAALSLGFDTRPPAAPSVPDLQATSDSGVSATDNLTRDRTPTFQGTAEAGATVTLYDTDGTTILGVGTADGSGNWAITSSTLDNDIHAVTARAVDAGGNASTASAALEVTIDALPPTVLTPPDLEAGSDTGASAADNITSDATPTISGVTEANATVRLYASDGLTVVASTTAGSDGAWSMTPTLTEGTHVFTVRALDAAGNLSGNSAPLTLVIDRSAPTTAVAGVALSADTGASATDFVTRTPAQTISGSLSADLAEGETVQVSLDDGASWTTAVAATGSNTWSHSATLASSGTLLVRVTDAAGNAGPQFTQAYTLDTIAPTVVITSDRATLRAGETATVTFTFSEDPGATFTLADIEVSGGTLGTLSGTGATRTTTFTPAAGVDNGTASITVGAGAFADRAGNFGSAGATPALTFDTLAPAAPSMPALQAGSDTGASGADGLTRDATPTFTGTAEANATVTVYAGGDALGTATADGSGTWTFTAAGLADGTYQVTARAVDGFGNAGPVSAPLAVTIDTGAPVVSTPLLAAASDTGASATDGVTADTTPTVTGTAEAGATVRLYDTDGTTLLGTATAGVDGAWSITSSALADGTHALTVRAEDAAGNVSAASAALTVVVDTAVPAITAHPDLIALSDTGASDSDDVTEDTTPTFTGTAEAGALVTLWDATDRVLGTAVAGLDGRWEITSIALAEGVHQVYTRATDAAGNVSPNGATATIEIDLAAPLTQVTGASLSADTGASGSDFLTNTPAQTITGTLDAPLAADETVQVSLDNGATWSAATATAGATGWSHAATLAGSGTLVVRVVDGFGRAGVGWSQAYELDVAAPAAPAAPVLARASDTGASRTDGMTSDRTPTVTGTAEAGAIVRLYGSDGRTVLGTATTAADGTWSITSKALAAGAHSLTVKATDTAGNTSGASASLEITIDASAPARPTRPDLAAASDSGRSSTDDLTNDRTPTVTGTAEAGATVRLYGTDGSTVLGTTTAAVDGSWSITSKALHHGTHSLTVRAEDVAGNLSAASAALTVTVDNAAPARSSRPDLEAASDTGRRGADNRTSDDTPTLAGTAEAGAVVTLLDANDKVLGTAVAADGTWTITSSKLAEGTHLLRTRVTDAAGNVSADSAALAVDVDRTAPVKPAAPVLDRASDTGSSASDRTTGDRTPTVSGTAEAGAIVRLYDNGGAEVLGTAVADAEGQWSITSQVLGDGAHQLTVRATDLAGNTSVASAPLGITVDATAPAAGAVASPQAAGLYHAGDVITITVRFSEKVVVTGKPKLGLETGPVDRQAVYAGGSGTDTLTFRYTVQPGDRSADLDCVGRHSLQLDGGTIRDLAGNDARLVLAGRGADGSLAAGEDLRIDGVAPVFASARIDGNQLALRYHEKLDGSALPAASKFTVTVDGARVGVEAVRFDAATNSLVLRLDAAATQGDAVRVSYADAAGDQARAIQDAAGNDAASLDNINVRNVTPNDPGRGGAITVPDGGVVAGQLLRADSASLQDADGVRTGTLAYQWLRDGVAIEGASRATYRLGEADLGTRISLEMRYRDGAGQLEAVVTPATPKVADDDGVATSVEALAPALAGGIRGDGNGDGVLDAYQSHVATAAMPGATGAQRFVTLVADDGKITGLAAGTASGNAPADARFGDRSVVIDADVAGRGATAGFSLFVAGSLEAEGLWLQDRSGQWHNATADLVAAGGKTRLDFTVRDGGAFDHDGRADGHVQLVGVVADAPTSIGGVAPGWDGSWF